MAVTHDLSGFHTALVVLGTATLVIPVFHRLRVSPVVGYILVGMAVGPFGLGLLVDRWPWLRMVTISDSGTIGPVAELGVVLLMFMIGLEMSFQRLWGIRRLVFGLGTVQLLASAVLLGAAVWLAGVPAAAAAVIGLALAMSSTAVVVQVLADERRLSAPAGRAAFAVLLFQDIAVVPVLFAIGVMGRGEGGMSELALALGQAALVVVALFGVGRLVLRRVFRSVARTGSAELFMAACLLVVMAAGLATAAAGLSMALGALIGGLLLAETEYRRQIEVTIEPFKGLLVGLFLISVGMGIDLRVALAAPIVVFGGAIGLVAIKLAVVVVAGLAARRGWRVGVRAGLLLGPGGEFGFVILGAAGAVGLVEPALAGPALIITALTMACIPLLSRLGERATAQPRKVVPVPRELLPPEGLAVGVIVAGFGRVGETVARLLDAHAIPFVAIDGDIDRVAAMRRAGRPVYWGDITTVAMLRRLGVGHARALVVTMGDPVAVDALVTAARGERADLAIIARARDGGHAAHLYALGATEAVPETIEASLQLSEAVLVDLGVPMGPVIVSIHEARAVLQAEIKALAPAMRVRRQARRGVTGAGGPSGPSPTRG